MEITQQVEYLLILMRKYLMMTNQLMRTVFTHGRLMRLVEY